MSFSSINLYLFCPRKWYYYYYSSLPKKTTYPLLFGGTLHHFIAYWLYRKTNPASQPRVFYYKSVTSAIKSWRRMWLQTVEKKQAKIILPDQKKTFEYMAIGSNCLKRYWGNNHNLPRPLAIEKTFKAKIGNWELVGTFDQLRKVSLDYIQRHRPELVKNNQLIEGFDPVVIIDLKSHYAGYDAQQFDDCPSQEQILRRQFDLHENLQPTIYTFLYEQQTGKKPIGFVWYHLRSGKGFFTFREDRDYHNLLITVRHVQSNVMNDSFPKRTGSHCQQCSFFEACRENRDFILSPPESLTDQDLVRPSSVPTKVKKYPGKQLKLNLRVTRKTQTEHKQKPKRSQQQQIVLYDLPWDD